VSNDASNENGTPSNDDVQDIVPTAAVSARHRWKEQTAFSNCNARNAEGQSALSISSSNGFLGRMKLLIDSGADVNLRDVSSVANDEYGCEDDSVSGGSDPCVA
jgi:ankyrin repeat protein